MRKILLVIGLVACFGWSAGDHAQAAGINYNSFEINNSTEKASVVRVTRIETVCGIQVVDKPQAIVIKPGYFYVAPIKTSSSASHLLIQDKTRVVVSETIY